MRGFFAFALCLACAVGTSSAACASWQDGACVCTATDCDSIEAVGNLRVGEQAVVYFSSGKTLQRLERTVVNVTKGDVENSSHLVLTLNPKHREQTIIGFGGAFTDAATINFNNVSNGLQEQMLRAYFGDKGIDYTLGRIPMAACDFSAEEYSYDDSDGDFDLHNFSIAHDHTLGRLDLIRDARALTQVTRQRNITLFASPWSPPAWMKTNGNRVGGSLKGEAGDQYHQAWAEYFVKFVSAYEQENIPIWGITVQNEPNEHVWWDSCKFDAEMERDFIKKDLGPKMRAAHPDVKIMILDDQFRYIEKWGDIILSDPEAAQYVSGFGFHWYLDSELELNWYTYLGKGYAKFPKMFFLATEASEGFLPTDMGPRLGSWIRGHRYAHDIIQDLRHGAAGWTDWNMFLDMQGGPNHAKNYLDSPILVDAKNDRFFKNPMYYVMGHFSKFIAPGSICINLDHSGDSSRVEAVGFVSADGSEAVVVLHNQHIFEGQTVTINTPVGAVTVDMTANSIATIVVPLA